MSGAPGLELSPCDWFSFAVAPGCFPSELVVQKIFRFYLLRLRLATVFDFNTRTVRPKASLKERFFHGRIRYLHSRREIEYRKRIQLWGIAAADLWARWNLPSPYDSHNHFGSSSPWRPRVGCGLVLGGLPFDGGFGPGGPGPGALLRASAGLPLQLLLLRPLSYSFKTSAGSCPGLRLKAYFDTFLHLPRNLSLWGDEDATADRGAAAEYGNEEEYGQRSAWGYGSTAGGGGSLRLLLRKTALVLSV